MLPNLTIILLLKPGVKRSYQGMLTSYILFIQAFVCYSWVGAAVMPSFVIFTPEGVSFILFYIACSQHIDAKFVTSGGLPGGNRVTLKNKLRG